MKKVFIAAIVLLAGTLTIAMIQKTSPSNNMTFAQVREMIEKDSSIVLLDVRTLSEWNGDSGHLKGAILIPVQELEARVKELEPQKHKTIIAYCRSGNRSNTATKFLSSKGFNVFNMEGGMIQWNAEKLPVVKEKPE